MKFSDVFDASNVKTLDLLIEDDKQAAIIERMQEPEIALAVMRSGLWSSLLFNQFTIPRYAAHIFQTLTRIGPVDNYLGPILAGVMGAIKGELYNNNVYGNPKECHSHYHDMVTAYLAAGGDPRAIERDKEAVRGLTAWLDGLVTGGNSPRPDYGKKGDYAQNLLLLLEDPLATFILVPANEKFTPGFFEAVSANLCRERRFDKYRQFVEKHIELDRGEHSSVAMEWLAYLVEWHAMIRGTKAEVTDFHEVRVPTAITKVINMVELVRARND